LPTARALSIAGVPPGSADAIQRVHGWWSPAAREQLIGAVASTLDREAAGWPVVQRARATGCADASTPALELTAAQLDRSAACVTIATARAGAALAPTIRRGKHAIMNPCGGSAARLTRRSICE